MSKIEKKTNLLNNSPKEYIARREENYAKGSLTLSVFYFFFFPTNVRPRTYFFGIATSQHQRIIYQDKNSYHSNTVFSVFWLLLMASWSLQPARKHSYYYYYNFYNFISFIVRLQTEQKEHTNTKLFSKAIVAYHLFFAVRKPFY